MTVDSDRFWMAKLAAWTHDPAEKSLVILRDPTGHEQGTVAALRNLLFPSPGLEEKLIDIVKTADQWAAAADRPQFPRNREDGRFAPWAQVQFDKEPILIHPLSGRQYDLKSLREVRVEEIKTVSFDHFSGLIVRQAPGQIDYRKTFLRFWRDGPESPAPRLGHLWRLLPADTRIPDHSIWEHLNLVSALAGAMTADSDGNIALLKMTIGPVQSFIAQARSTSDLWAGSHLLSRVLWAGLEILCARLGPDSVVFPDLHGIPLVDVWLEKEQIGFKYKHPKPTDENPLFSAALPNLFVAIVPEFIAVQLARDVRQAMRDCILTKGTQAANALLEEAGAGPPIPECMSQQLKDQLSDFPEVYWSIVPWRLAVRDGQAATDELSRIARHFYPPDSTEAGFLSHPYWKTLSQEIRVEGALFYHPNPGALYPALYDLLDRSAAAAKSIRSFRQLRQEGYRCSICGEREWLTWDRVQLTQSRQHRRYTIWEKIAEAKPSWAKRGEHLCALCTLKRLWPSLFVEEVKTYLDKQDVDRFVISTHTMAIVPTLQDLINKAKTAPQQVKPSILKLEGEIRRWRAERTALPARLYRDLRSLNDDALFHVITKLPSLLERAAEAEEDITIREEETQGLRAVRSVIKEITGHYPERYYALLLMDGDNMGSWISGTEPALLLPYRASWHPAITSKVANRASEAPDLKRYLDALRVASPGRHVAISRALNGFAIRIARTIVEEMYAGKILYAGGDDIMAMVSVHDLLDVMLALRSAYSGLPFERGRPERGDPRFGGGHVLLATESGPSRLLRMMGPTATASMGAVVAHYSTPLGAVMRQLRAAERLSKAVAGKDAFTITLMKRAGGQSTFSANWQLSDGTDKEACGSTVTVLNEMRLAFAAKLSRQAAYRILEWLTPLSEESAIEQLQAILVRELRRHKKNDADIDVQQLAVHMAGIAERAPTAGRVSFLRDAINLTEFLAREGRA